MIIVILLNALHKYMTWFCFQSNALQRDGLRGHWSAETAQILVPFRLAFTRSLHFFLLNTRRAKPNTQGAKPYFFENVCFSNSLPGWIYVNSWKLHFFNPLMSHPFTSPATYDTIKAICKRPVLCLLIFFWVCKWRCWGNIHEKKGKRYYIVFSGSSVLV